MHKCESWGKKSPQMFVGGICAKCEKKLSKMTDKELAEHFGLDDPYAKDW